MTSRRIQFTGPPDEATTIDLGGDVRVLDLQLTVVALTPGQSVTIDVLTSTQNDADEGWARAGGFTKVDVADEVRRAVITSVLRYVRFEIAQLIGGSCYFVIDGEGRSTL